MYNAQVLGPLDLNLDEIRPMIRLDFACGGVRAAVVGNEVKSILRHCRDVQLEIWGEGRRCRSLDLIYSTVWHLPGCDVSFGEMSRSYLIAELLTGTVTSVYLYTLTFL